MDNVYGKFKAENINVQGTSFIATSPTEVASFTEFLQHNRTQRQPHVARTIIAMARSLPFQKQAIAGCRSALRASSRPQTNRTRMGN